MVDPSHQALAGLLRATSASPAEKARALEQALVSARGRSPEACLATDAEATDILWDRRTGDALLEHISLDVLGDLVSAWVSRLECGGGARLPPMEQRRPAWRLLDVLRRSSLLCRIRAADAVDEWAGRLLSLVDASHFTFGQLFSQRASGYGARTLFRLPGPAGGRAVTWRQVAGRVELIARALHALTETTEPTRVGLLSENCLEMALVDLACLSSGMVNVVVPATSTERDVAYILGHSRVGVVIVSSSEQLGKVLKCRDELPELEAVVVLDHEAARARGVQSFDDFLRRASGVPAETIERRRNETRIEQLATVMYTSGTTGQPKGIVFSHRNIVFKRFARALALPEIGESDCLLSYLPLFHTFGRFLEMTGCVFWGATYCFAENPAVETLMRQMQEQEPTVFVSIPIKWMQLYDAIREQVDVGSASDAAILETTRRLTGGKLRWGLSAAGYLDPDVFRFFQRQGIELMSGFGMTEATGGITMTSPGRYKDDSLGVALPGIEIALAGDGELKIRGPYVMTGYLDPPGKEPAVDEEGWFHTGDLMEMDRGGEIRIVDRKKEIYKNVKGETVAPQRVENLFRDFDSVGRVFVVGDHREYNTALIYPNPEAAGLDLAALSDHELKAHFGSLVVSANSFLAPFERIVDFAVVDRDFSANSGELTPKGTFRRKVVERNFSDLIRTLYRRARLRMGAVELLFPNWLFQALGVTAQDLRVLAEKLTLASVGAPLTIRRKAPDRVQVGQVVYSSRGDTIDLGALLSTPRLWLGNEELVEFAPLEPEARRRRPAVGIEWESRVAPFEASPRALQEAGALLDKRELDLMDVHRAALLLESGQEPHAVLALRVFHRVLELTEGLVVEASRLVLRRASRSAATEVRRRALQVLLPAEQSQRFRRTLAAFLDAPGGTLDQETAAVFVERGIPGGCLDAFVEETEARCLRSGEAGEHGAEGALLGFLADYGAAHPSSYRRLRAFVTRIAMVAEADQTRTTAAAAQRRLEAGFRTWLGPPSRIAVDPETGLEYRWSDVVAFAEDVEPEARERLLGAIESTPVLREAAFLFSGGTSVRLSDILPAGVWVKRVGSDHGKTVYRVAVKTRLRGQFDMAVNLNHSLSHDAVERETNWLIVCGEGGKRNSPLVEGFGGHWPEYDLWTEEFVARETLDRALRRYSRREKDDERFRRVWSHAAWSAMSAYVDLWDRTGEARPSPQHVVAPMHDFQRGPRLVSIRKGQPFATPHGLLRALKDQLVTPVEAEHPRLAGSVGWDVVCSALLEVLGEEEGLAALRQALADPEVDAAGNLVTEAQSFIEGVERRGFLPRRLFFAARRYRRWADLNPEATALARANTLKEVYETYGLDELRSAYPEVRARFFRATVFREAPPPLAEGLDAIVRALRSHELVPDELSSAVTDLRAQLQIDPDPDYFLARLSFPYLRPEDQAGFVFAEAGGSQQTEMVVTLEDEEGGLYNVRHAVSAREVGRLHGLFVAAALPVGFRPEHRFLVALNERGHLLGGLFYELRQDELSAHMDKVVVAESFQGRGVASALIEELCNRLRTAGYRSLTTGFFRPEFFYGLGFSVERRYAGLVRTL